MSVCEIRHLLSRLYLRPPTLSRHYELWSIWRIAHQMLARYYHYRKRLQPVPT